PGIGRARSHGERSVGTADPGAISLALIAAAVGRTLAER
ncbi:DAK2 domain-containing protein, partial [Clavibacter michiganensis]